MPTNEDSHIRIQTKPINETKSDTTDSRTETLTADEALAKAIELHQKSRHTEARAIYTTILKTNPAHSGALHFLGILYFQSNMSTEAIELITLALKHDPDYTDARNNLGNIYKQTGSFAEAESAYRRVLAESPQHAHAANNLATVLKAQGKYESAVSYHELALSISPNIADYHYNLGNTYCSAQRWNDAKTSYRNAIQSNPEYVSAYRELGSVQRALGEQDEALESLSKAAKLNESHADVHHAYGVALQTSGLLEDAAIAYVRAIEYDPKCVFSYPNLIITFNSLGRLAEAEQYVRRWLKLEPASATANHMLASITGNKVPDRATDSYIKGLFDAFSDQFDEKLQTLEYQAPQLLLETLLAHDLICKDNKKNILDAGCGTGLCGPLFRDYAHILDGVDLSPGMLNGAKKRDLYDNLHEAELTAYLQQNHNTCELIISADTLVYFGDLTAVMNACHQRLKSHGWLAFSVERLDEDQSTQPYRLNLHGRYSHTHAYIIETLTQHGFCDVSISEKVLRQEMGKPVNGYIVLARAC